MSNARLLASDSEVLDYSGDKQNGNDHIIRKYTNEGYKSEPETNGIYPNLNLATTGLPNGLGALPPSNPIETSVILGNAAARSSSVVSSIRSDTSKASRSLSTALRRASRIDADHIEIKLEELEDMSLTWHNINVFAPTGSGGTKRRGGIKNCLPCFNRNKKYHPSGPKQILKDVYGYAEPGQLLAIMGGSGAGKTTMLNVLTHRNTGQLTIEGVIKINGEPVSANVMRSISAYVQQDDLFIGTLTVKETLIFQALLRMNKSCTYKNRLERVEEVISELGLGKCANTMIGVRGRVKGISGGERKRLAFASEVLTDPPLMFCDEPTSGLDSFMAQQVIAVLQSMAHKGKTIVCTIHQPSSQVFAMFDQLCLMAEGKIVYLGPTKNAPKLFERIEYPCPANFNPADHYIRTLAMVPSKEHECRKRIKDAHTAFEKSGQGKETRRKAEGDAADDGFRNIGEEFQFKGTKYKASWWQQFRALMWRSSLGNIREPLLLQVRLYQTIVISVLLGLVYMGTNISGATIQNVNGVLFLFVTNMTFQFVFAVVNVFCEELPVFMREHLSGIYRVDVYYLSKMLAELPQYIVFPIIFSSILYWMSGVLNNATVFFILVGINILTANVAVSLGYMVSCIAGDINIALVFTPICVIPFMLFGGFYLNQASVPVYFVWLKYLSYFKYSYEALAINLWQHVDYIPGCANFTCPSTGAEVLQTLSFDSSMLNLDIVILAVFIVGIRIIAFLALLLRSYLKK